MSKPSNAARALLPMFLLLIGATSIRAVSSRGVTAATAAATPAVQITFAATVITAAPRPTAAAATLRSPSATPAAAAPTTAASVAAVPEPSATPQPQITATATAALTLPKSALLDGIKHQQQTWNNCGPANISMLLNFHGIADTQRDAARFLKPVREDKNVSPQELVAYTESRGLRARWVIGADMTLLKSLIAAGLPVIAESWFIPKPNDEMGHYELIHGYDGDTLIADDSYEGPNQRLLAADWEPLWKVFNYSLIVVWPEARDTEVRTLLGDRMDDVRMAALALDRARQQTAADPDDKFAWFNIGTNLLSLGDAPGATTAFEKADSLKLPWRMLWYQHGPYEANYAVGNFDQVLKLTNRSLKATGDLEESYFWRGKAHLALGKRTEARRDFSIALKLNPNYSAAAEAAQQ